jgi:hypothetical protein
MKYIELYNKILSGEIKMDVGLCRTARINRVDTNKIDLLWTAAADWTKKSNQVFIDRPYKFSGTRQNILLLLACYCKEY